MKTVYAFRRKQLLAYMEQQKLDTVMITSAVNVYYFTGFSCEPHERFLALVLDAHSGGKWLFLPSLDVDAAKLDSTVQQLVSISDTDNAMSVLKHNIGSDIARIGIEKNDIRLTRYEQLKDTFPQAEFFGVEDFIFTLRMKKSESEIVKVRKAVDVIQNAIEHATQKIAIGMTEFELVAELEYQMRALGSEKLAFDSIVLAGKNAALPHGKPGHNTIKNNDFVLIDIGVFVEGFCSDITRTFIMGEGTKEQEKIYKAVLSANLQAIETVKSGIPFGELDRVARNAISSQGYGEYFIHRLGHGLGMEVHEAPSISGQNELLIEPGMLFTIEPGIYIPSIGGVRIEDDIYIKEDGTVEILTDYTKELVKI